MRFPTDRGNSLIHKLRQNDHYEVSLQFDRVPNSTVFEESVPSMIVGVPEGMFR